MYMCHLSLVIIWKQNQGGLVYAKRVSFIYLFIMYLFIYLFIYLAALGLCCCTSLLLHVGFLQLRRAGATLHCGAQASHFVGFSCWSTGSRRKGFSSCGMWASVAVAHGLQTSGSVVVAHELICSAACEIFPAQGSNPCPLHGQVDY